MNAIFLELRKNTFYTLIPVILFFSYSLAYLLRAVILAFLNPSVQAVSSNVNPTRKVGPETNRALSSYEEMVQGNLIRGIVPRAGEISTTEGEMSSAPPDTGEGEEMKITGTLSGHWSFARVTIVEKGKPEAQEFATGETVAGYKIRSIALNYVVLEKGGIALKVEIGQTPGEARAKLAPDAGAKAEGGQPASADTIRKVLSRQDVNRKLKDPTAIYKNGRFGPALINGKIAGYKIYSVAPDHIFYALGARNGDIIKRVNGMPLTETEKMLEIWGAVKTADKITVDVERGSQILTYEFIIRN